MRHIRKTNLPKESIDYFRSFIWVSDFSSKLLSYTI